MAALSGPNPAGGEPGAAESWWLSLSFARAVLAASVILVLPSAGSSTCYGKEWRWTSTVGAERDGGCCRQQFSCVDGAITGEAAPRPSPAQVGLKQAPSVVSSARPVMSREKAALVRPGLR